MRVWVEHRLLGLLSALLVAVYGCTPDPCLNGGICSLYSAASVCHCPVGFYGVHCQQRGDAAFLSVSSSSVYDMSAFSSAYDQDSQMLFVAGADVLGASLTLAHINYTTTESAPQLVGTQRIDSQFARDAGIAHYHSTVFVAATDVLEDSAFALHTFNVTHNTTETLLFEPEGGSDPEYAVKAIALDSDNGVLHVVGDIASGKLYSSTQSANDDFFLVGYLIDGVGNVTETYRMQSVKTNLFDEHVWDLAVDSSNNLLYVVGEKSFATLSGPLFVVYDTSLSPPTLVTNYDEPSKMVLVSASVSSIVLSSDGQFAYTCGKTLGQFSFDSGAAGSSGTDPLLLKYNLANPASPSLVWALQLAVDGEGYCTSLALSGANEDTISIAGAVISTPPSAATEPHASDSSALDGFVASFAASNGTRVAYAQMGTHGDDVVRALIDTHDSLGTLLAVVATQNPLNAPPPSSVPQNDSVAVVAMRTVSSQTYTETCALLNCTTEHLECHVAAYGLHNILCDCEPGYTGADCTTIDSCLSNPCQNGGSCTITNGEFVCTCPLGYSSALCSVPTCSSSPCSNGASCSVSNATVSGYLCDCLEGFAGDNCDQFDLCFATPCSNGATCVTLNETTLVCNCNTGYTGLFCNVELDECLSSPCHNGGSCIDLVGDVNCNCLAPFFGPHCASSCQGLADPFALPSGHTYQSYLALHSGCAVVVGDIVLQDVSSADALLSLVNVTGSVYIDNTTLTDLSALANLRHIGGGTFDIRDNAALVDLASLSADLVLSHAAPALHMEGNHNLASVSQLANVLAGMTLSELSLVDLPLLASLDGIHTLAAVESKLTVKALPLAQNLLLYNVSLNGADISLAQLPLLTDLTSVFNSNAVPLSLNSLLLHELTALTNFAGLESLTSVTNLFSVSKCDALTSLFTPCEAVGALTTIGSLSVTENSVLESMPCTLQTIMSLTSFAVSDNPSLLHIRGPVNVVSVETLSITNNLLLRNINGFVALVNITSQLTLLQNPRLHNMEGLLDLEMLLGTTLIGNNSALCLHTLLDVSAIVVGSSTIGGNRPASDPHCDLEASPEIASSTIDAALMTSSMQTAVSGDAWLSYADPTESAQLILDMMDSAVSYILGDPVVSFNISKALLSVFNDFLSPASTAKLIELEMSTQVGEMAEDLINALIGGLPCDESLLAGGSNLASSIVSSSGVSAIDTSHTSASAGYTVVFPPGFATAVFGVSPPCHATGISEFLSASSPFVSVISNQTTRISSSVVSLEFGDGVVVENLVSSLAIELSLRRTRGTVSDEIACVFWDTALSLWSSDGCEVVENTATHTTCRCTHATSFALLAGADVSDTDARVLSILTYVGCGLSIVACVYIIVTFIAFSGLQTRPQWNIFNLAVAVLGLDLTFVAGADPSWRSQSACRASAVLIYYFLMCGFLLTACIGRDMMFYTVKLVGKPTRLVKYALFSWLTPALLTAILVAVDAANDFTVFGFGSGSSACFVSTSGGLIGAVLVPLGLIMAYNVYAMARVSYAIRQSSALITERNRRAKMENALIYISLAVSMGLTWLFAFLGVVGGVVFWYMFVVLNASQGLLLCLLFWLRGRALKETRRGLWKLQGKAVSGMTSSGHQHRRAEGKGGSNGSKRRAGGRQRSSSGSAGPVDIKGLGGGTNGSTSMSSSLSPRKPSSYLVTADQASSLTPVTSRARSSSAGSSGVANWRRSPLVQDYNLVTMSRSPLSSRSSNVAESMGRRSTVGIVEVVVTDNTTMGGCYEPQGARFELQANPLKAPLSTRSSNASSTGTDNTETRLLPSRSLGQFSHVTGLDELDEERESEWVTMGSDAATQIQSMMESSDEDEDNNDHVARYGVKDTHATSSVQVDTSTRQYSDAVGLSTDERGVVNGMDLKLTHSPNPGRGTRRKTSTAF